MKVAAAPAALHGTLLTDADLTAYVDTVKRSLQTHEKAIADLDELKSRKYERKIRFCEQDIEAVK